MSRLSETSLQVSTLEDLDDLEKLVKFAENYAPNAAKIHSNYKKTIFSLAKIIAWKTNITIDIANYGAVTTSEIHKKLKGISKDTINETVDYLKQVLSFMKINTPKEEMVLEELVLVKDGAVFDLALETNVLFVSKLVIGKFKVSNVDGEEITGTILKLNIDLDKHKVGDTLCVNISNLLWDGSDKSTIEIDPKSTNFTPLTKNIPHLEESDDDLGAKLPEDDDTIDPPDLSPIKPLQFNTNDTMVPLGEDGIAGDMSSVLTKDHYLLTTNPAILNEATLLKNYEDLQAAYKVLLSKYQRDAVDLLQVHETMLQVVKRRENEVYGVSDRSLVYRYYRYYEPGLAKKGDNLSFTSSAKIVQVSDDLKKMIKDKGKAMVTARITLAAKELFSRTPREISSIPFELNNLICILMSSPYYDQHDQCKKFQDPTSMKYNIEQFQKIYSSVKQSIKNAKHKNEKKEEKKEEPKKRAIVIEEVEDKSNIRKSKKSKINTAIPPPNGLSIAPTIRNIQDFLSVT